MTAAEDRLRQAVRRATCPADPTIDNLVDSIVHEIKFASLGGGGWLINDGEVHDLMETTFEGEYYGYARWQVDTCVEGD